jgi:5-methylcytosine-specific restriction endonuclease McrA
VLSVNERCGIFAGTFFECIPERNTAGVLQHIMPPKKLPHALRAAVWSTYMGRAGSGKCTFCKTEEISPFNFECGHIISRKEGGEDAIENLRPICGSCNKSMGTKNMEAFRRAIFQTNSTDPAQSPDTAASAEDKKSPEDREEKHGRSFIVAIWKDIIQRQTQFSPWITKSDKNTYICAVRDVSITSIEIAKWECDNSLISSLWWGVPTEQSPTNAGMVTRFASPVPAVQFGFIDTDGKMFDPFEMSIPLKLTLNVTVK